MTKKDIILFLHIFLQAYKRQYPKRVLLDLRDDVYSSVKKCVDFFNFKLHFMADSLYMSDADFHARKDFCDYLNNIYKIVKS